MALIVEAAIHSDRGNGCIGLAQGCAGLLYSVAIEVLYRREVEALFEVPFESAERESADLGQVFQFNLLGIVFANVVDRLV